MRVFIEQSLALPESANYLTFRDEVMVLMAKCDMTEEEVVAAYSDFNTKNPEGIITKADFLDTMEVGKEQETEQLSNCFSRKG